MKKQEDINATTNKNTTTSTNQLSDAPKTPKTRKSKTVKPMALVDCFKELIDVLHESSLKKEVIRKEQKCINFISDKLHITPEQAVLLTPYVNDLDVYVSRPQVCDFFGCAPIDMLQHWKEIETLYKQGYLVRNSRRKNSYGISNSIIEVITTNSEYKKKDDEPLDAKSFVGKVHQLTCKRLDDDIEEDEWIEAMIDIIDKNQHLTIAKELAACGLNPREVSVLSYILNRRIVCPSEETMTIKEVTAPLDRDYCFDSSLKEGNSEMQQHNYLEFANVDGIAMNSVYSLTREAITRFLSEYPGVVISKTQCIEGVTHPGNITEKQMFYSADDMKQIETLTTLLQEERYQEVRGRLKDAGMRQGFCCLFYGGPGTGKTETVMQLARQTGREIMRVDISSARDKFYGETEKIIKKIFMSYRALCKECDRTPILLFNEADAILSTRTSVEGNNASIAKTENAIQNILLEEMENLDGIMIATTNLTNNLDAAFERRFIYKMEFHKPSQEAKECIWKSMIPQVKEESAKVLANDYDFSGGQIENVARKYMVDTILHGNDKDELFTLDELCRQEILNKKNNITKIGFN